MQKNELSIVILAAGKGTRMHSSTPKPLHKICGQEMISYIIKEASQISDDITIVLGYQKEQIASFLDESFPSIHRITQDLIKHPGTAGALKNYSPRYDRILILNADMPLIQASDLQAFISAQTKSYDIIMGILEAPSNAHAKGYGRVLIENGKVQAIVEEKDASFEILQTNTLNAGVYCFSKSILERYLPQIQNQNAQQEYYLTDTITLASKDKIPIYPLVVSFEHFQGVNTKQDLAYAEEILANQIKNYWMQCGVRMRLPSTIYIESEVIFQGECTIENGVSILGKSCIVDSHIKQNSIIQSSHITKSSIGPFAHIRPQSHITKSRIGNFVEVKKSQLQGTKAGHLSYLGDCSIDEGSNIGAGFITCNYDGKTKHQTKIGKQVFIGSHSQAIAPVVLEDECIIGAGTTITQDVKKGELVLTRPKETRIKDFFYKFFNKSQYNS